MQPVDSKSFKSDDRNMSRLVRIEQADDHSQTTDSGCSLSAQDIENLINDGIYGLDFEPRGNRSPTYFARETQILLEKQTQVTQKLDKNQTQENFEVEEKLKEALKQLDHQRQDFIEREKQQQKEFLKRAEEMKKFNFALASLMVIIVMLVAWNSYMIHLQRQSGAKLQEYYEQNSPKGKERLEKETAQRAEDNQKVCCKANQEQLKEWSDRQEEQLKDTKKMLKLVEQQRLESEKLLDFCSQESRKLTGQCSQSMSSLNNAEKCSQEQGHPMLRIYYWILEGILLATFGLLAFGYACEVPQHLATIPVFKLQGVAILWFSRILFFYILMRLGWFLILSLFSFVSLLANFIRTA